VSDPQDNHSRTDDTALLAVFEPEHQPMAGHGLLAPADPDDEDARDDGLAAALAKAAPRKWWNRGTLVLGAVALILAGFLGGLQVQKHFGTPATAAAGTGRGTGNFGGAGRGAGAYGFPGGAAQGGAAVPGGAAPAASAAAAGTTGTVKLVDGDTIYVQTANGDLVTVKTSGSTAVKTATAGTLKDVKAGDAVTVQGASGTDGTVTATSVTADRKK
jgi:hypothetical protein